MSKKYRSTAPSRYYERQSAPHLPVVMEYRKRGYIAQDGEWTLNVDPRLLSHEVHLPETIECACGYVRVNRYPLVRHEAQSAVWYDCAVCGELSFFQAYEHGPEHVVVLHDITAHDTFTLLAAWWAGVL